MVTMNRKMFLIVLICIIIISVGIVVAFYLINEEEVMPLEDRRKSEKLINDEDEMLLTEEQQQLLKDSILQELFEEMNNRQRKSAWMLLNAMDEVDFVEHTHPGESGVFNVMWILGMLGIELIGEIEIVSYDNDDIVILGEGPSNVLGYFVARIIVENGEIYYLHYHQTLGLQMVIKGSEDGKLLYSPISHSIRGREIRVKRGFEDVAL
ncbi:MAG: hypothetical protein FWC68_02110 [Oscillospiraceae bacterium]|nr:hypothetical protein [Oscillospiraceae bacterium]